MIKGGEYLCTVSSYLSCGQVARFASEVETVRQSAGTAVPPNPLHLPEELTTTSAQVITSLNEYLIQLLQVNPLVKTPAVL